MDGLVSLAWRGVVWCGVVWCIVSGLRNGLSVRYNLLPLGLQDRRWTGWTRLRIFIKKKPGLALSGT